MRLAPFAIVLGTVASAHAEDSRDRPTETGVELVAGSWHDDVLVPGAGWHRYTFVADASGLVAFEMRAPAGADELWPYLLVVDRAAHEQSWASVGNRITNACELVVPVTRGTTYEILATSQPTASLAAGAHQRARGTYTVAVVPIPKDVE